MKLDQIRKGARVLLNNGWEADILDNYTKRAFRLAKVYGFVTEMGSIRSIDISEVRNADGDSWEIVEHNKPRKGGRRFYSEAEVDAAVRMLLGRGLD